MASDHTHLPDVGLTLADVEPITARHGALEDPSDLDEKRSPLQNDDYIFEEPRVFSKQGFQTASLDHVSVAQATALSTMKDGAGPGLASTAGFPTLTIGPDVAETFDLSTETPTMIVHRVMEYVRPCVLPGPALLLSDEEIADTYFACHKLAGDHGSPGPGAVIWGYSMFKGSRILNLPAAGDDDEPRRPMWISKTAFLGASGKCEARMQTHLTKGQESLSSAGKEHRTDDGLRQSLAHAVSVAEAMFDDFTATTRSGDGEPQLKKARKCLPAQTNPPVKVPSKSGSIIAPKLLRSLLHGNRTTFLQLYVELESSGENPSFGALADLVGVRTSKTKLDSDEKLRSVLNAISTALGHVFPDFSVGSVSREWSVTFRASMDFYFLCSSSVRSRIRALELYGQMHWFALIQHLPEMRDPLLRATAEPVDFTPGPLAWAECCYKAEGYQECPQRDAPNTPPLQPKPGQRQSPPHKTQVGCNGGKPNPVSPTAQPRKMGDRTMGQTCKKAEAGQPRAFYDPSKMCCVFRH